MIRVALFVSVIAGCKGASLVGSASGHLESTGGTGAWVLDKGPCYSGDPRGFFGVTVESPKDDGVIVKLVKDPVRNEWSVVPNIADSCKGSGDCKAMIFTKDECKKLDVKLAIDPTRKTKMFSGTAEIDCTYETAHVWGTLTFDHCR